MLWDQSWILVSHDSGLILNNGGHTLLRQSWSSTLTHSASPKPYLIIHLKDCLLNALSLRGVTLYSNRPGRQGALIWPGGREWDHLSHLTPLSGQPIKVYSPRNAYILVKKGCLTSCLQLCTPAVQATHGTWGPGRGQPISWSQESVGLVHSGNSLARWSPHAGFPKQVWTCPLIPPSGLYKLGPPLASCGSSKQSWRGASSSSSGQFTIRDIRDHLPCVNERVSVSLLYV